MKTTIALVDMADDTESFFIRNPPDSPIEKWIGRFVSDVAEVEFVEVLEAEHCLRSWSNPNVCPES